MKLLAVLPFYFGLVTAFSPSHCYHRLKFQTAIHDKDTEFNFHPLRQSRKRFSMKMISPSSASSGETGHEDLLLKISFSVKDGKSTSEAKELLNSYIASFPFSAVLPVQPLTYIPREDGNGVDVSFLRKKTKEKGAIDGGMHFITEVNDDVISLVVMRDSEGQTVSKAFTEGLVIKSFVSGLYDEGGRTGLGYEALMESISIEKCVHKWM